MPESIFFKSTGHKQRFLSAIQQFGHIYSGKLDPEYGAALYVLTADHETWGKSQQYIEHNRIDFEEMLQKQDWSGGYRVLIEWAANLFSEFAAHVDPVQLMRLDESNFKVALAALQIRRYSLYADQLK